MKKTIFTLFAAATTFVSAFSQNVADPGITLAMSSPSVRINNDNVLTVTAGNFGNSSILSSTMRIVLGVGTNAEIVGLAPGSDARWSIASLSSGAGNTVILTNTGGSFGSHDTGNILLTLQGTKIASEDLIIGNICYIPKHNAALGGAPNPAQGNESITNDNAKTPLDVHSEATVDVNSVENTTGFTVYPNPFNDQINLTFDHFQEATTATIFSIEGKLISTQTVSGNNATINTKQLASGIYVIQLSDSKSTSVQKLVKNNK